MMLCSTLYIHSVRVYIVQYIGTYMISYKP